MKVVIIGYRNHGVVLISWAWNHVFYDRPVRLIRRGRDGTGGEMKPGSRSAMRPRPLSVY